MIVILISIKSCIACDAQLFYMLAVIFVRHSQNSSINLGEDKRKK